MSILKLVKRLGDLTNFREQQLIEESLLNSLLELVPSYYNALYQVTISPPDTIGLALTACSKDERYTGTVDEGKSLPPAIINGIQEALSSKESMMFMEPASEEHIVITPIIHNGDDVEAVLVQSCKLATHGQQQISAGLLRVYSNFLSLLQEHSQDTLTGLLNRRTLDEKLATTLQQQQSEFADRRKDHRAAWIGILDIDHFKKVNDTFGHLYGDEVLILISRLMEQTFREDDLFFRYGGEEFIVLLKADNPEQALIAFERFRLAVEKHHFPQVGYITVSIGIAMVHDQDLPSSVIGQADKALYFSKENGRNQTNLYEELMENGKLEEEAIQDGEIQFF